MRVELPILFSASSFALTPFGLMMALGCAAGLAHCAAAGGRRALFAALCAAVGAVFVGHAVWGLVWVDFDVTGLEAYTDGAPGWTFLLQPWLGGSCLYGALAGGLLGAWLWRLSRRGDRPGFLDLLDRLAPGACAALVLGRAAEVFNGQGVGEFIENEAFQFFPLCVCTYADEEFSTWQVCVWFWEAAAALALLAALVILRGKRRLPEGRLAGVFLLVLSASQIFLEQLRKDDALKFGFVISFTQIAAAVTIAAVLTVRLIRARGPGGWDILRLLTAASGFCAVIFAEFVFDKPQFYLPLRIAMAATALSGAVLLIGAHRRLLWLRIIGATALAGLSGWTAVRLGAMETDVETIVTYAIIFGAMLVTGAAALNTGRTGRKTAL